MSKGSDYGYILGTRVDVSSYPEFVDHVASTIKKQRYGYVCVANVHMIMEAHQDKEFKAILNSALIVTPDGMPLVWGLKLLGFKQATRLYGPSLTLLLCEYAAKNNIPVGFLGGSLETLQNLVHNLKNKYPELPVPYTYSPPFKDLTNHENAHIVREINISGARILFVGLGCPKQERWMAAHKDEVNALMIGVGAAFDFHAGMKPQAPPWMQRAGLEWLFRLISEPKRLWKRYLYHNPRFIYYFGKELLYSRLIRRNN
jgi:N-acetylglucosaminyldiphosphoundecaprenol N-acetyl-beta-D-mannosaminyltransferase